MIEDKLTNFNIENIFSNICFLNLNENEKNVFKNIQNHQKNNRFGHKIVLNDNFLNPNLTLNQSSNLILKTIDLDKEDFIKECNFEDVFELFKHTRIKDIDKKYALEIRILLYLFIQRKLLASFCIIEGNFLMYVKNISDSRKEIFKTLLKKNNMFYFPKKNKLNIKYSEYFDSYAFYNKNNYSLLSADEYESRPLDFKDFL